MLLNRQRDTNNSLLQSESWYFLTSWWTISKQWNKKRNVINILQVRPDILHPSRKFSLSQKWQLILCWYKVYLTLREPILTRRGVRRSLKRVCSRNHKVVLVSKLLIPLKWWDLLCNDWSFHQFSQRNCSKSKSNDSSEGLTTRSTLRPILSTQQSK